MLNKYIFTITKNPLPSVICFCLGSIAFPCIELENSQVSWTTLPNNFDNMETTDIPYKIILKEGVGRCIVASRNIPAGQLILKDEALAEGPKEISRENLCLVCLDTTDLACSKCNMPMCKQCKNHDLHFSECEQLLVKCVQAPLPLKYSCVTPFRLWKRLLETPVLRRRADLLMDHADERRRVERIVVMEEQIMRMCKSCEIFRDDEEEKLFLRCVGLLQVNCVTAGGDRGRAMFPTMSFLSHSCANNARHIISKEGNPYKIR